MRLEWLCGSVYKVFAVLLQKGETTPTELVRLTGYNHIVIRQALRILEKNGIVVCSKWGNYTLCRVNEDSKFVKAFRAFIIEAGIELPKPKPKKEKTYKEVAREIVDYLINNWNNYLANVKNDKVIKVTAREIRKLICDKAPARCSGKDKSLVTFSGWVISAMIEEFEKRGYKAYRDYDSYFTVLVVEKP